MTKRAQYGVILGLVSAIGCSGVENTNSSTTPPPCDTAINEACTCSPNTFIACEGDAAVACNGQGDGTTQQSCGAAGCNMEAGGCNACVANTDSCSADFSAVEHCGTDSKIAQRETCAAGCVTDALGSHCQYIDPAWLGGICDKPSTIISTMSNTLDVDNDAACTGGVVVADTTFCVVRAKTIDIGSLKVTGRRAVAFVADDTLTVSGTLDVSADGTTSGPGATYVGEGVSTTAASYLGAGGAGFTQVGGTGGANDNGSVAGQPGGATHDRSPSQPFRGGAKGGDSLCQSGNAFCFNGVDSYGGGGGGAALLISCRGTVKVTGIVDAGGGGGQGGVDHYSSSSFAPGGAPGGGSGGFVAFEGVRVELTGKLYANGGGGGGGCNSDNCVGLPGADGLRATVGASGGHGPVTTTSCSGGAGGSITNPPGNGFQTYGNTAAGAGGGGGSMGRFLVLTPSSGAAILTTNDASPQPETSTTKLDLK